MPATAKMSPASSQSASRTVLAWKGTGHWSTGPFRSPRPIARSEHTSLIGAASGRTPGGTPSPPGGRGEWGRPPAMENSTTRCAVTVLRGSNLPHAASRSVAAATTISWSTVGDGRRSGHTTGRDTRRSCPTRATRQACVHTGCTEPRPRSFSFAWFGLTDTPRPYDEDPPRLLGATPQPGMAQGGRDAASQVPVPHGVRESVRRTVG
jgi:hypothetical protein